MFAEGADEVCREFISFVLIAADGAAPDGLAALALYGLRFRLDICVIVAVSRSRCAAQYVHISDAGDEEAVCTQVDFLSNISRDKGISAFGYNQAAISAAPGVKKAGKFISVTARLKTKAFKQVKIGLLTDDGGGEFFAGGNHISGVIAFVDGDSNLIRVRGNLRDRVDDTTVVLAIKIGREDIEPIGNIKHGLWIHNTASF